MSRRGTMRRGTVNIVIDDISIWKKLKENAKKRGKTLQQAFTEAVNDWNRKRK